MSGPAFFQTGYGRRFFDAQLPDLIRQLTRIADALEAQAAPRRCEGLVGDDEPCTLARGHTGQHTRP